MSQDHCFDEEDLVQLFCGDCSYEQDPLSHDDSNNDDGTEAVEVEVMQETIVSKRRRKTKDTINQKKGSKQMSEDELVVELDELIKKESLEDVCFYRGKKEGVCTCLHILREERLRSPVVKYLADLKLNKSKHDIDSLILEWYKYASRGTCASAGVHNKIWYNLPYDGSDAYCLNINVDPLKDALICQEGLYRLMGFSVF